MAMAEDVESLITETVQTVMVSSAPGSAGASLGITTATAYVQLVNRHPYARVGYKVGAADWQVLDACGSGIKLPVNLATTAIVARKEGPQADSVPLEVTAYVAGTPAVGAWALNTAGLVGGSSRTPVAATTAIPLNVDYSDMAKTVLIANLTLTVASGAVVGGVCNATFQSDGVHTVDTSAFTSAGYVPDWQTPGLLNKLSFWKDNDGLFMSGFAGGIVATVPGQVTGLTLGTATTTSQPLTWAAPASGGTPTDYLIEYKAASSGTWLTYAHAASSALAITVGGLPAASPGVSYNYRVSAVNSAGTGAASSVATGSLVSNIAPPTVTATIPVGNDDKSVLLTFSEDLAHIGSDSYQSLPIAMSAFSFVINGVTKQAYSNYFIGDFKKLEISVSGGVTWTHNDVVTISYTQPGSNPLASAATGALVPSFTNKPVTNSTP
jgi:hypothetical protein